eukprot:m51a1_g9093 hypothetical protein (716) ;mRNA; f:60676-64940
MAQEQQQNEQVSPVLMRLYLQPPAALISPRPAKPLQDASPVLLAALPSAGPSPVALAPSPRPCRIRYFMAQGKNPFPARIIVTTHGTLESCGVGIAAAMKALPRIVENVIVIGPCHRRSTALCGVTSFAALESPLGVSAVDTRASAWLRSAGGFDVVPAAYDSEEYSVEAMLPWIQTIAPRAVVTPILVGEATRKSIKERARFLASMARAKNAVIVVTADFGHWGAKYGNTRVDAEFGTGEAAIRSTVAKVGARLADMVMAGQPGAIAKHQARKAICGYQGLVLALYTAKHAGWKLSPVLVSRGVAAGPENNTFHGYAGITFHERSAAADDDDDAFARSLLLLALRATPTTSPSWAPAVPLPPLGSASSPSLSLSPCLLTSPCEPPVVLPPLRLHALASPVSPAPSSPPSSSVSPQASPASSPRLRASPYALSPAESPQRQRSRSASVRPFQWAGTKYPAAPEALSSLVHSWMSRAPSAEGSDARVVVVPHGHMSACGMATAAALGAMRRGLETVLVFGPMHRRPAPQSGLTAFCGLETPLGVCAVDAKANAALRRTGLFEVLTTRGDYDEYSVETVLPFVQMAFPSASVVPVLFGTCSSKHKTSKAIAALLRSRNAGIVVTCDLACCRRDSSGDACALAEEEESRSLISAMLSGSPTAIKGSPLAASLCGHCALTVALAAAQEMGWTLHGKLQSHSVTTGPAGTQRHTSISYHL